MAVGIGGGEHHQVIATAYLPSSFYELRDQLDVVRTRSDLRLFETDLEGGREDLSEPEYKKLRLVLGRRWKGKG